MRPSRGYFENLGQKVLYVFQEADIAIVCGRRSRLVYASFRVEESSEERGRALSAMVNEGFQFFKWPLQEAKQEKATRFNVGFVSSCAFPQSMPVGIQDFRETAIEFLNEFYVNRL